MKYDRYASHLPVLIHTLRCLGTSVRSILEIGCGFYSTPILAAFSLASGCEHVVIETERKWAESVSRVFGITVDSFSTGCLPPHTHRKWDVVFIDSAVAASRAGYALALRNQARVILLHDSNLNWDRAYHYKTLYPQWRFYVNFTETYPHTLLLTNDEQAWESVGKTRETT